MNALQPNERAITQAYRSAGIGVADPDFAEVHDCFTIAELLITEALGLCAPGGGPAFGADDETGRDGRLRINLSGGLKAKGLPVGATGVSMHALLARHLTGRAGQMQLDGASLALCLNMGGVAVASAASVLERAR